jgi:hypothetical protein
MTFPWVIETIARARQDEIRRDVAQHRSPHYRSAHLRPGWHAHGGPGRGVFGPLRTRLFRSSSGSPARPVRASIEACCRNGKLTPRRDLPSGSKIAANGSGCLKPSRFLSAGRFEVTRLDVADGMSLL